MKTTAGATFATGPMAIFGSIMILIGTSIGAGMLALPLSSAQATYPMAVVVLVAAWFVMTVTGLLILEVNFAFPVHHNHFHSMTKSTLGRGGQIVSWICCIGLFYAVISSYIAGSSSLITHSIDSTLNIKLPIWSSALIFTILVATVIYYGTRGVDLLNRGLMSFKGILLIIMLSSLLPHINLQYLTHISAADGLSPTLKNMALGAPIFLFGFGYHAVIPSLVNYVGPDKNKMRMIIITGTSVSLVVYLLWLAASFGIIPSKGPHSFSELSQHGNHLTSFLQDLETMVPSRVVHFAVNGFSNIALTTSCLGVSLGLFDFIADGVKAGHKKSKRLLTIALTFIPPLIVALLFPNFFLLGLSIAVFFVIILEILIPVAMVYKFRQYKMGDNLSYKVRGGNNLLIITGLLGLIFLACSFAKYF
jgi:tyrosine-specific transport protein